MRAFVQPLVAKKEINGDSNYLLMAALVAGLRRERPDLEVRWGWPTGDGFHYVSDGTFDDNEITRVAISPERIHDPSWYADALARGVDVAITNYVETVGLIRAAAPAARIVAAHNYVFHDSLPQPLRGLQNLLMLQLVGAYMADVNVHLSDHCRWMLADNARRFLRPEAARAIEEKSVVIAPGPLDPADWPLVETENEIPVVIYNHRLADYKLPAQTFGVLEELHREGIPFRVVSTAASDRIARLPFVEVRSHLARSDYLAELRRGDLNVTSSLHETFCLSAVESMACGQPLVAPDGITFPEIVGRRANDYPYLFKTRDGQRAALRRLLLDPSERRRWGRALHGHVVRSYTQAAWARAYAALLDSITRGRG